MCEPMALVVDDDADLYVAWNDSPAADPTQYSYPTHKLGSLVQQDLFSKLHLRLPDQGGPHVKHVPGDGNCANGSLRRGCVQLTRAQNEPTPAYDADLSCHAGVRELKEKSFSKLLGFAVPDWAHTDSTSNSVPLELSVDAISRLQTFGSLWLVDLMDDARARGFQRRTKTGESVVSFTRTLPWLREALAEIAKKKFSWVGVAYYALAAAALGCNIVLWEFDGDEHLVPFWDGSKISINNSGMFLVSPDAGYIHLLLCAFSDWHRDVSVSKQRWAQGTRGSSGFNHFEYISDSKDLRKIEEKINTVMGKYPSQVFATRAVVTHILPPPVSPCDQPECSTDSSTVGKGKGRARDGQTKTCSATVKSTGQKCRARQRPGTSRCGRHKLPEDSSQPPEGSDFGNGVDGECYMDGSDLLGPGAATTKSTTPARYVKDLALIDSKYHKAFRNLWRMTVGKLGKTFTVSNASVRYIVSTYSVFGW